MKTEEFLHCLVRVFVRKVKVYLLSVGQKNLHFTSHLLDWFPVQCLLGRSTPSALILSIKSSTDRFCTTEEFIPLLHFWVFLNMKLFSELYFQKSST